MDHMRTCTSARTTQKRRRHSLTLSNIPYRKMAACSVMLLGSLPAACPAAFPPACLPAYLLPAYVLAYHPAAYLPTFLPACCLLTYACLLPAYLHAPCLPTCSLPTNLPNASLQASFLPP